MERKVEKIYKVDKQTFIFTYSKFQWHLVNEEEDGDYVTITMERDESMPHYQEVVALENSLKPKCIPLLYVFIPMAIAVLFISAFLIVYLFNKESFDKDFWSLVLFLPGVIFLFIMFILFFIRNYQIIQYNKNFEAKQDEVYKKLKELTNSEEI